MNTDMTTYQNQLKQVMEVR